MKILTLNTWTMRGPWKDRWEIIFRGLEKMKPDIVALQEVFDKDWALEVQKRAGFDHLIFPESGGGLMALSRYPVAEWKYKVLAAQSPTEDYKRFVLYARLEAGSQNVALFNTHLSWKPKEGEIREYQVGELLEFARLHGGKEPIFYTGDFNAAPDTTEVRRMMLEGGFIDLYGIKHPKDNALTWDNRNPFAAGSSVRLPDRRIDFIFMQGISITKVNDVKIVFNEPENGIYASDHFGVLADVTL